MLSNSTSSQHIYTYRVAPLPNNGTEFIRFQPLDHNQMQPIQGLLNEFDLNNSSSADFWLGEAPEIDTRKF